MRRWFVLLMIVLLPWRAWAGDAMLLSAPSTPVGAAHCADHAMSGLTTVHANSEDRGSPEGTPVHATCDICNGPAMAVDWVLPVIQVEMPQPDLTSGPVRFASAPDRRGLKPPIA